MLPLDLVNFTSSRGLLPIGTFGLGIHALNPPGSPTKKTASMPFSSSSRAFGLPCPPRHFLGLDSPVCGYSHSRHKDRTRSGGLRHVPIAEWCPRSPGRTAKCGAGKTIEASAELQLRESARPTKLTGIGRSSHLYSENGLLGEMATSWASLPLPLQRSHFELLAFGLPGPTGISPSQSSSIRSQDGPSCIHRISASFRNPLGSRTISMRSVHRDFQSPMTLSEPVRRSWFRSLRRGRVRMSLSWLRVACTRVSSVRRE